MLAVAGGKAALPIADIDATVLGEGHARRVAPERVKDVRRSCAGTLGVDDPGVILEMIDQL